MGDRRLEEFGGDVEPRHERGGLDAVSIRLVEFMRMRFTWHDMYTFVIDRPLILFFLLILAVLVVVYHASIISAHACNIVTH